MAFLSQEGQVGLRLFTPSGTRSALDAQIFISDNDLELKSAKYGLWAKSGPRPIFIQPAESCKKKQRRMCMKVSPVAKLSISMGGDFSGVHKGSHVPLGTIIARLINILSCMY